MRLGRFNHSAWPRTGTAKHTVEVSAGCRQTHGMITAQVDFPDEVYRTLERIAAERDVAIAATSGFAVNDSGSQISHRRTASAVKTLDADEDSLFGTTARGIFDAPRFGK